MSRLPQPGSDNGTWGDILNDYLLQSHNADGTIKDGAISESALDLATQTKLNATTGTPDWSAITNKPTVVTNLTSELAAKVATTVTVNGHALGSNVTVTGDDVLPTQTGNGGKYLTTNGSTASWASLTTTPIQFSAAVALTGVTPTDRAYVARTLTGARMRTASAPSGSALTVQVQHWDGSSWTTIGTLSIASGSTVEAVASFSQAQTVGNMVRLNVTSIGSTSAATGVAVDVLWS